MSSAGRDANGGELRGRAALAERLVRDAVRLLSDNGEATIVVFVLAAFVAAWMLFWEISTASVDVHFDASEAVVWAQHFAFGYKHPPLTGWLFALWFAVFPRQQWAMNLLTVMTSAVAACRELAPPARSPRQKSGVARSVRADAGPALRREGRSAQCQHRDDPGMGGGAAVLSPRAPRARAAPMRSWLARSQASRCSANTGLSFCSPAWRSLLWWGRARDASGVRLRLISWPLGAAIVLAPHVWWMLTQSGASVQFAESVVNRMPFGAALVKSANYFVGSVAYIIGRFDLLRRAAPEPRRIGGYGLADRGARRQAWILLLCRSCCRRWLTWPFRTGSPPRLDVRPIGRCCRSFSTARARSYDRRARDRAGRPGDACGDARHAYCVAIHRLRKTDQRSRPEPAAFPASGGNRPRASPGGRCE